MHEGGSLSHIESLICDHLNVIEALRSRLSIIEAMGEEFVSCLQGGGRVFWLGNGGSAADCQHLAAELVGRFELDRRGLASIALTTDSSILTSVGNDYGFEEIFARQIQALCRPEDLVVGISTSGNSPNIARGLQIARTMGIRTIGLTGRDGGRLKELADLCLVVPSNNTARTQEAHILIGHLLCDLVERRFATAKSATSRAS